MTTKYWILALAACACVAPSAKAARIVGNGGVGVWCEPSTGPATHKVLDYYEVGVDWQMTLDLGAETLDYHAKAQLVVDRIAHVDPARGALYAGWLATFDQDAMIYSDLHFDLIHDYGSPHIEPGCRPIQIAQQVPTLTPDDHRYLIDGTLWNLLDADNKAGLVIHELIFRDALQRGQTNSIAAHYFTALYSSTEFETMTAAVLNSRLHTYYMDAYQAVPSATEDSTELYLYFDGLQLSLADARAQCATLGTLSGLIVDAALTQFGPTGPAFIALRDSAIGTKLLGETATPQFWLDSGHTYAFSSDSGTIGSSPATASVVCWTIPPALLTP